MNGKSVEEMANDVIEKGYEQKMQMLTIEHKVKVVTTIVTNVMFWLVMGAVALFAVWGITFALDNILTLWRLK